MADFIFIRKSRNALSSALHIILNILLGVGSVLITLISGSWVLGILLVIISKWRVFAVRPRFWFLNIKSSLVDLIVGASFIFLTYLAGTDILPIHFILAALYTCWLIFLKPRTSELATIFQAICAVLLGTTATVLMTSTFDVIVPVLIEFIIGYGASRHIFAQIALKKDYTLLTLCSGLIFSEFTWIFHSWSIIYTFGRTGFMIPQLAIVLSLFFFAATKTCISLSNNDGTLKHSDFLPPVIFSTLIIAVMLLFFSNPIFNV